MPITPMQYNNNRRVEIIEERNDLNQEEYNVNDIQMDEGPEMQEICYEDCDKNNETGGEIERVKILEEDIYYNILLKFVKQYNINKLLNILIEILNKNDFPCNNLDEEFIKEEIIDITKIPPPCS